MPFSDLREFVCKLDEVGELAHVRKEVDPRYEVGAICKTIHNKGRQALLFERVRGCSMPVATELLGTFKSIAIAIDADEHDLFTQVMERTKRSIEAKRVPRKWSGPSRPESRRTRMFSLFQTLSA